MTKYLTSAALLGAILASSPAFAAREVAIKNFTSDVNISDSLIVGSAGGMDAVSIIEFGTINSKDGSIRVDNFSSKVTIKDSRIFSTAVGYRARSRISFGSASTD